MNRLFKRLNSEHGIDDHKVVQLENGLRRAISGGPQRPRIEPSDNKVVAGFVERAISDIKKYLSGIEDTYVNEMLVG